MNIYEVTLGNAAVKAVVSDSISNAISYIENEFDYESVVSAVELKYNVMVDPSCVDK